MQNYRKNIWIQITIQDGCTGMEKLNVQQTLPPVPGL